jgi:DNA polymerase-3 subunit alpha
MILPRRSNTRSVNRKSYENLVYGGAFDGLAITALNFLLKQKTAY